MKMKYCFFKKIYPNDVILFIKDNKYLSYGYDHYILSYIKYNNNLNILNEYHINYLIIENLNIIDSCLYDDNNYIDILYKALLSINLEKILKI